MIRTNGALLVRLRQEREVKQLRLSDTVEIDVRTLRRWEHGHSRIDLEQFNRLAEYFGYSDGRFVELLVINRDGEDIPLRDHLDGVRDAEADDNSPPYTPDLHSAT